jgi:hypothetical protein
MNGARMKSLFPGLVVSPWIAVLLLGGSLSFAQTPRMSRSWKTAAVTSSRGWPRRRGRQSHSWKRISRMSGADWVSASNRPPSCACPRQRHQRGGSRRRARTANPGQGHGRRSQGRLFRHLPTLQRTARRTPRPGPAQKTSRAVVAGWSRVGLRLHSPVTGAWAFT